MTGGFQSTDKASPTQRQIDIKGIPLDELLNLTRQTGGKRKSNTKKHQKKNKKQSNKKQSNKKQSNKKKQSNNKKSITKNWGQV